MLVHSQDPKKWAKSDTGSLEAWKRVFYGFWPVTGPNLQEPSGAVWCFPTASVILVVCCVALALSFPWCTAFQMNIDYFEDFNLQHVEYVSICFHVISECVYCDRAPDSFVRTGAQSHKQRGLVCPRPWSDTWSDVNVSGPKVFKLCFSPPVKWGLLDFMYDVLPSFFFFLPSSFLLLPPRLRRHLRRHLRQMWPDVNMDLQSAVGNAGPQ